MFVTLLLGWGMYFLFSSPFLPLSSSLSDSLQSISILRLSTELFDYECGLF